MGLSPGSKPLTVPSTKQKAVARTRSDTWHEAISAQAQPGSAYEVPTFPEAASPSVGREALSAPVIGFRAWNLDRYGHLCTVGAGTAWQTTMKARCRYISKHEAPEHFCECGLYAYHDPNVAIQGIVGAILAWGKLEAHSEGFRAEYARILALSVMDDHLTILRHNDVCPTVVPFENLEAFAREHGDPVPENMRFH